MSGAAFSKCYTRPLARVEPRCPRCQSSLVADVLAPVAIRQPNRIGAPARPRLLLPAWRCPGCGCIQPRVD